MTRRTVTDEEALERLLDELRRGLIQCVRAIDTYQEHRLEKRRKPVQDLPKSA